MLLSQAVYINKEVQNNLLWFADCVLKLDGVCLFSTEEWNANEADVQIWCNASKEGLAFWIPQIACGFVGDAIVEDNLSFNIFSMKCWLSWLHSIGPPPTTLFLCDFPSIWIPQILLTSSTPSVPLVPITQSSCLLPPPTLSMELTYMSFSLKASIMLSQMPCPVGPLIWSGNWSWMSPSITSCLQFHLITR